MRLPIDSVESFVVRLPTRSDFRWNGLDHELGQTFVVRVRSGELSGYGETVPLADWGGPAGSPFGETPEIDQAVLHGLMAPRVIGMDAGDRAEVRTAAAGAVLGYPYALGALDIAVHDLVGCAWGLPVYDLLGGRRRVAVPIAHMIGLGPVPEALAEAQRALAEGCRAFQVKGGQDLARDVQLVQRLRAMDADVLLRLDANCGYGAWKAALGAVRALASAGADMVEQPAGERDALRRVAAAAPIPIVADEACWSTADALAIARECAADALSIYVAKAGGPAEASGIARVAAAAGMPHDLNGSLEAGIGNAASLHVAVASAAELLPCVLPINGPAHAAPTHVFGRYFADDLITGPMTVSEGAVVVGDGPGLGVEVDADRLESASVRHRATTAEDRGRVPG